VVIDPKCDEPFVDEISPWPDLSTLQRRVGGYVELVCPPSVRWHAYVAEAGKQRGLPYNSLATDLARASDPTAELYGTVVIVGTEPANGTESANGNGRRAGDVSARVLAELGLA
jgi:Domain of unknown function (DUF3846)